MSAAESASTHRVDTDTDATRPEAEVERSARPLGA